ncbi:response regulator transcription factor [Geodermatophilus sp. DF01-2]|uniref:response regulator n=1 Tax=Geodermatophilus sp. DF01-2 TaxID=2559610 RepID=UPI001073CE14|nr:response regulator transcription factor [Geodermatophilus sp. DF01_2]TFV52925.1 response regulator transcription factor [Geodermatophilus sp. DF01_2]
MIRVLVVDDHAVVRRGISSLLAAAEGLECVGAAGDGHSALDLVEQLDPDVVLLDLSMPGCDGITVIRSLRERGRTVPVLVLTSFGEPDLVLPALTAGADGYLLKYQDGESILEAVRCIAAGGAPVDPMVTTAVLADLRDRGQGDLLTDREKEVLELVRQGLPNKVIARRLRISEATVKTHVTRILQRIGVADRTQAALWAERRIRPAPHPRRSRG